LPNHVQKQRVSDTLEKNFMPYAMSVILSRAIPEIDGFKPSHRKLLFTMHKMGLLNGSRRKSADIVGQTMQLNPHGDGAIYETMVRLTRGNSSLNMPFVDSKGNFGKVYSRDTAYAASRYTEAKLDTICNEIFRGIDRDAVDFMNNYNNTQTEPMLLPTAFPNILVSANTGIAVGMASNFCGFNLTEVCETTIAYLKNEQHDLFSTLPAPDFPTGGEIIFDAKVMEEIYRTGRGSFKVRAKYRFDKAENCIEVYEIPYTTTIEAIIDKIADLVKTGKIKEVSDVRDEMDIKGLTLAIDLKRGTDPDKLMQKLYKMTPLCDSFSCNFNLLVRGGPQVLGVRDILREWCDWRIECIRRELIFELSRLKERLHLLQGLGKILLDIDRAIAIIRETEEESEVVPNLMIGFGIDEIQADYIADIRLRNINKAYILKKIAEIAELQQRIEELTSTIESRKAIISILIAQLDAIIVKYKSSRRSSIVYEHEVEEYDEVEHIEDYPVHIFLTHGSYFKKITPNSLRMSGEQKYKEGDSLFLSMEAGNKSEIMFLTNKQQAYKCRLHDFEDTKTSALGDYVPSKLSMDEGEVVLFACLPGEYKGFLFLVFENGKAAKVALSAYQTTSNRKKLTGAYSDKSPLVAAFYFEEDAQVVLYSTAGRALIVNSALIAQKTTRATQGVAVMQAKKGQVDKARLLDSTAIVDVARYRTRTLPAAGALLLEEDRGEKQLTLDGMGE